jgi:U3 small nucleolar RNA-associated protein 6
MSGTSDKARFYLEQAVPQLQEFKEKEIFTTVRLPTSYAAPTFPILFDLG